MPRKRLAPGTYRLAKGLANPLGRPRVKTDWTKRPRFEAGESFLVELVDRSAPKGRVMMKPVRGRGLHLAEDDAPYDRASHVALFRAIAEALVPAEEDLDAMFARLSVDAYDLEAFVRWLVERGEVPRERFASLFATWRDG